jgi:hypothetical protein
VVLAAVKQCGAALQYAHRDLRADVEVVREAVRTGATNLRFAAAGMLVTCFTSTEVKIGMEAVRTGATNLRFAAAGVYICSLLALLVHKYKC